MDTLPPVSELAKSAIISYLAYFTREERVEQIYFLLAWYTADSCLISENLRNVIKLLADYHIPSNICILSTLFQCKSHSIPTI